MSFLIGHYIGWIFVSLFLGAAAGWIAAQPRAQTYGAAQWIALAALGAGLLAAFLHIAPGRLGHGLEVVLLLVVSYILGCLVGEPLRLALAPPDAPKAAPVAFISPTPASDEPVSDEHRPLLLAGPPPEGADDLKLIWGVGPKLEEMLNRMGVYRFDQIAAWNEMNLRWVDQNLESFKGRAVRDRWIDQAGKLASGWRPESAVGERFDG